MKAVLQPLAPKGRSGALVFAAGGAALLWLCLWALGHTTVKEAAPTFGHPRDYDWWQPFQTTLAKEVAAADEGQGWEVVFYGDSITEALRGTQRGGELCPRCKGSPVVFNRYIGSKYRSGLLGISGDQSEHLMWRLVSGGELPHKHQPKVAAVLMGTNDLGYASSRCDPLTPCEPTILAAVNTTVERVRAIVRYLEGELPQTQIALLALLPRAKHGMCGLAGSDGSGKGGGGSSSSSSSGGDGSRSLFATALERVNSEFRELAAQSERVTFVNCAGQHLLKPDGCLDLKLIPDSLHPNAEGYEAIFSKCWAAEIAQLMEVAVDR